MSILTQFLEKKGIKDPEELSQDERQVYLEWKRILSDDGEMTVDKIKQFCENQVDVIESKWKDLEYGKKADLIPYHTCYKLIIGAIDSPKGEREALEKHLNQLISS
jgi:hypothetical protein